jgi:hypothetical protein
MTSTKETTDALDKIFRDRFSYFLNADKPISTDKMVNDAEKIINDYKSKLDDSVDYNTKSTMILSDDDEKKEYQDAARHIVKSASPSEMLILLEKLQQNVPFGIVDPKRRILVGGSKPNYSMNELYKFIGDNFNNSSNLSRNLGEDPFYTPMNYPDPTDLSTDSVLQKLIAESPYQKFLRLYDQYKTSKTNPEVYANRIRQIYNILTDPNHVANPWYLTKYVKGQERPMESYVNDEFMATLSKFSQKNTNKSKPTFETVTINMPPKVELDINIKK